MNNYKNLFVIALVALFSLNNAALAKDSNYDYHAKYYEDEGNLLFKVRGFYMSTNSKPTGLPSTLSAAQKPGSLVQNGLGVDTAVTYFFTDNFAVDFALGIGYLRVKNAALTKAATSLGDGTGTAGKNNNITIVPASGSVQYHIAPFGALRPYVGAGLHGTYMYTRSKAIKVSPGYGPVLQLGIDFMAKDDTLITLDIRQYFLKSKVSFKKGLLGPNNDAISDVGSKVKWNPLVVSVGFGFLL